MIQIMAIAPDTQCNTPMICPRLPLVMIDCLEARSIVLDHALHLPPEICSAGQTLERVLAQTLVSPACLPPFDNAAMDGFALHVGNQGAKVGTVFVTHGIQAAGDAACATDVAVEVMTGACVPAGLNAVVPVEKVDVVDCDEDASVRRIRLRVDVAVRRHIRQIGEDVVRGATIMRAGELVQPQHLMLIESLGLTRIAVTRAPRVAVICTGRELVDDPSRPLRSGEIRNSNGPFLAARIAASGAECVHQSTVGDEPEAFLAALEAALRAGADMVLSTGAVSMGRYDFVPQALRAANASILFHKVRMRPGKPLLFARLPGGALFFGLPGNPVAAAVGFRFFVEPALRAMLGMFSEQALRVPLTTAFKKHAQMGFYLKARLSTDTRGQLHAAVLPGQESFRILPLAAANAWIELPEGISEYDAGTLVDVYGLGHLQPPSPLPDFALETIR